MSKLFVHEEVGLYTEISLSENQAITKVPSGWVPFDGDWEEAQEEGLIFMGHAQAGFVVEEEIPQSQETDPWSSQPFG